MTDQQQRRLLNNGRGARWRRLFPDGAPGKSLSVTLPPGELVWPDLAFPQCTPPAGPAFWISDDPAPPRLWSRLRAEHARSGLWPVLLDDSTQPWTAGQIAPEPVTDIDTYDPAAFLAEVWADHRTAVGPDDDLPELAPYGRTCPGLAAEATLIADPGALADDAAEHRFGDGQCRLGLVAARRGADVPAVMGWQGAINHNEWIGPLAAVLRGWEDRFGLRVVRLGFNTLDASVAAPPRTLEHAVHIAAEHWAFCPDAITQGPGDLTGYAEQILGARLWSFWWD
jgi:hypothetical protein